MTKNKQYDLVIPLKSFRDYICEQNFTLIYVAQNKFETGELERAHYVPLIHVCQYWALIIRLY